MANGRADFLSFLVVRTVLEFATFFLHESIGRRRAPEARRARNASILRGRLAPSPSAVSSFLGDSGCKTCDTVRDKKLWSCWDASRSLRDVSSKRGEQRAA